MAKIFIWKKCSLKNCGDPVFLAVFLGTTFSQISYYIFHIDEEHSELGEIF